MLSFAETISSSDCEEMSVLNYMFFRTCKIISAKWTFPQRRMIRWTQLTTTLSIRWNSQKHVATTHNNHLCWSLFSEMAMLASVGWRVGPADFMEWCNFIFKAKGSLQKKIRDYLGILPKRQTPPYLFENFDLILAIFFGHVGKIWVILRCCKFFFN